MKGEGIFFEKHIVPLFFISINFNWILWYLYFKNDATRKLICNMGKTMIVECF